MKQICEVETISQFEEAVSSRIRHSRDPHPETKITFCGLPEKEFIWDWEAASRGEGTDKISPSCQVCADGVNAWFSLRPWLRK